MERWEEITPLTSILNPELQIDIFKRVTNLIYQGQLTLEVYEKIKNYFVGRGKSAETYIQDCLDIGKLKWQNERLVEDLSHINIILTIEEEETLRQEVIETGLSSEEIIRNVIHKYLIPEIPVVERG